MKTERMRAWIFLYAEDAGQAVEEIKGLFTRGEDDFVVIRADRVTPSDDFPFNLVVPVDARDEGVLAEMVEQIVEMSRAKLRAVAQVEAHTPFPPQRAHAFVTALEAEGDLEFPTPGRQGKSPGRNPWG